MTINDTLQLSVQGVVSGQTHVHTLHFRDEDIGDLDSQIIDEWQAGCRTSYRQLFNNTDLPCQLYTVRQVCGAVPLRAPVEESEVAPNIAGSGAKGGGASAPWLAAVVSERTALAGRSRRGRFFIGGLWEDYKVGANISAAEKGFLQDYVDDLISVFGASGSSGSFRLVVHSPTLADVPGTQCQDSSTPVTGMIVRDPYGTMKSRKAGSGT
jgi:hypothetical protein